MDRKGHRIAITRRKNKGIVLIIVAGVLTVLAALVVSFYLMAQTQQKAAMHYSDSVRARLMADAGVNDAIARLRAQAYQKTEDPADPWFNVDYLNGKKSKVSYAAPDPGNPAKTLAYSNALGSTIGINSDRYTLQIEDAASKININACDNLGVLLDNLCRVIGPPLVAADQDKATPRVWEWYGATPSASPYANDWPSGGVKGSAPYGSVPEDANYFPDADGRPMQSPDGSAMFGDGYAIAGYRSKRGLFQNIEDVKNALTYVKRPGRPELEELEREVKFQALKPYITVNSWVDINTACTGKFEWISHTGSVVHAIDRDKSWVADMPATDPLNHRGSLRGCYLSIISGHGAGQLRRIRTNGIDWVEVDGGFAVDPGPTSSYMIIANEDAKLVDATGAPLAYNYPDNPPPAGTTAFPMQSADGTLVDEPKIDYKHFPLCIHRAPVNINTASDKVLAALFLGINVQYGTFMALGTDGDLEAHREAWFFKADPCTRFADPYTLPNGLGVKRIPVNTGRLILDRPRPWAAADNAKFGYINNMDTLGTTDFATVAQTCSEAHELAYRVIIARQPDPALPFIDSISGGGTVTNTGLERKPFASWDDLYFRVVRPWDDIRVAGSVASDPLGNTCYRKASIARMLMAQFNSNTDILKMNPNIEWIDRWGRNFTEMEQVMQFTNDDWKKDVPFNYDTQTVTIPYMHVNPAITDTLNNDAKPVFTVDKYSYLLFGSPHNFVNKMFGVAPVDFGSYVTRTFRYKADELIDKTDLNRSTTELTFDSGGIFQINSVGQVVGNGQIAAETKIEALVQVYDVWRETTQRQFVQGTISHANGALGTDNSGQVARDSDTGTHRRALVTQPEPLVPLNYKIVNPNGNAELVDRAGQARDAYGNAKNVTVPDVIANRVLPSGYDGQLMLATNTLNFDPNYDAATDTGDKDTFLSSFNGDLDTDTSNYNGREQAKVPWTDASDGDKYRVCNSCGLLGLLNDNMIAFDPGLGKDGAGNDRATFMFQTVNSALKPLNPNYFWNNVTCRKGDLRTDGVYVNSAGLSGRQGTLKYLFGPNKENFDPGSQYGNCISMWMKPTWHEDDGIYHELFNASNPGSFGASDNALPPFAFFLCKPGKIWPSDLWWGLDDGQPGGSWWQGDNKDNDLLANFSADMSFGWWDRPAPFPLTKADSMNKNYSMSTNHIGSFSSGLHGGSSSVPAARQKTVRESPSYRVQPFRWHYIGMRENWTAGRTTYGNGSCIPNLMFTGMTGFWKKDFNAQNTADGPGNLWTPYDSAPLAPTWPPLGWNQNTLGRLGDGKGPLFGPPWPPYAPFPSTPASPAYMPGSTRNPTGGGQQYGFQQGGNATRHIPFNYDVDNNSVFPMPQYLLTYRLRPFIDTQRNPDWGDPANGSTTWKPNCFYAGMETPIFWDQQGSLFVPKDGPFGPGTWWNVPPDLNAVGKVRCDIGNSGAEYLTNPGPKNTPRQVEAGDSFTIDWSTATLNESYNENGGPSRLVNTARIAQDAKWDWADPAGVPNPNKIFGLNNINYSNTISVDRLSCTDGTFAVIDELKISSVDRVITRKTNPDFPDAWKDVANMQNPYTASEGDLRARPWMDDTLGKVDPAFPAKTMWQKDRIAREQTTSRYYLDTKSPPTFTSQSMLQSLEGFDKVGTGDPITLVRVSWTVFTPRFMSEYKAPGAPNPKLPGGKFQRYENITHQGLAGELYPINFTLPTATADLVPYKGPFDYKKYNDLLEDPNPTVNNQGTSYDDPSYDGDMTVVPYRCLRPKPTAYPQYAANKAYQSNSGVEVEVLNGAAPIAGEENSTGSFSGTSTFTNPDVANHLGKTGAPAVVTTDKLHYRVRFKYPIDPLADPAGGSTVDGTKQYLLDSPVFDDVSIVFMTKPRILTYRVASE
jgi:hypothetical protein